MKKWKWSIRYIRFIQVNTGVQLRLLGCNIKSTGALIFIFAITALKKHERQIQDKGEHYE